MRKTAFILILFVCFSCGSTEEPEFSFFLSKEWKMVKVLINGEENTLDKSLYRLQLNEDLSMRRVNFDGSVQEGDWALENGNNQLILLSNSNNPERYLIVDLQIRRMVLQVVLSDNKIGATEYRYILEPTRP